MRELFRAPVRVRVWVRFRLGFRVRISVSVKVRVWVSVRVKMKSENFFDHLLTAVLSSLRLLGTNIAGFRARTVRVRVRVTVTGHERCSLPITGLGVNAK